MLVFFWLRLWKGLIWQKLLQRESTTLSFQRFKLNHFLQVVCSGWKNKKSWTEKNWQTICFWAIISEKNVQMLLQHVVNKVIWLIGSLIFNVLCFRFYFRFQILNLLLIFSRSLQVFTHFKSLWWLVATF